MENENISKTNKRRRSSFVRGRLSMNLGSSSALCQNISTELPPEERFLKLVQLCYEKAAETAGKEIFPDNETELQNFIINANKEFEIAEQYLKEKDICRLAVTKNTDNETTVFKDPHVEAYEEYISKLSKESALWDNIIEQEKEKLIVEEQKIEEPLSVTIPEERISEYNSMLSNIRNVKTTLQSQIKEIEKVSDLFTTLKEVSEEHLKCQKNLIGSTLSKVEDTPRKLIKNIVEIQ